MSLPVADLRKKLKELPRDRQIVAYCRGPYCLMAVEAVATLLRKHGFAAVRSELGVAKWCTLWIAHADSQDARGPMNALRRADGAATRIMSVAGSDTVGICRRLL